MYAVLLIAGILSPTDEFRYWADMAASGAKGEDRERARYFSDTFQRQIAPQFATLSTLSIADVRELAEETQDVLDELWKQTDFDKPFPEAHMRRLLEVIGIDIDLMYDQCRIQWRNGATSWYDREFLDNFCTVFVSFVSQLKRKIRVPRH